MSDFKTHKISSAAGLMLDNLVYNRHGEVHGIRINDLHAFDHPDMGGNYGLYGIPLTEEWLIRMGFDKIRDGQMSPDIYGKYYTRVLVTSVIELQYDGLDCRWMEGNTNVPIEFVHQLQNLYFSLTGEELTIK